MSDVDGTTKGANMQLAVQSGWVGDLAKAKIALDVNKRKVDSLRSTYNHQLNEALEVVREGQNKVDALVDAIFATVAAKDKETAILVGGRLFVRMYVDTTLGVDCITREVQLFDFDEFKER